MKTSLPALLLLILLTALPLWGRPAHKDPSDAPHSHHETRTLQLLLTMDESELVELRQTIERIERMTPEEKVLLRERIGKLEKMKPEHVEAMRQRFEAIPKEKRDTMHQHWLEMSPEARQDWRKKLRNMSREERAKTFDAHGFLPTPSHSSKANVEPPSREQ